MLAVDRDPKFQELTRRIDTSLRVGSAHHKNTDAKADGLSDGALGDTPRAFANGRRDDGCVWLPRVVFAINNAPWTLGGDLTPFSIAWGQHPRPPVPPPGRGAYTTWMKALEQDALALLHVVQQEREAALDRGRADLSGGCPDDAAD